jgi:iron complex outermembrane receptor protein
MKKQCAALLTAAVMTTALLLRAALAQDAAQAAPNEQMRTFDIPSQPLSSAITAFARQSGLQVSANADFVRDVATPGVSGTLSPSRALAALLSGTGLSFRFTDSTTVTLERLGGAGAATGAVELDPVRVQAEIGNQPPAYGPGQRFVATRSAAGTKTETPLLETPASISIITRKQIEEQGAQSVSEAVRTTPGVVTNWAGYDNRYDFMYVRGFPPTTFLNGLILPTGSTSATHGIPADRGSSRLRVRLVWTGPARRHPQPGEQAPDRDRVR